MKLRTTTNSRLTPSITVGELPTTQSVSQLAAISAQAMSLARTGIARWRCQARRLGP